METLFIMDSLTGQLIEVKGESKEDCKEIAFAQYPASFDIWSFAKPY